MPSELLIPPAVRIALRAMRLTMRGTPGGLGLGYHTSRSRGPGLEFAQYRAYEPGDEPRQIDWKLYARSDRFFVRDATRDSPLTVWLLMDATASMSQADHHAPPRSKFAVAKSLAACIVQLALQQGDRFGLIALSGAGVELVPSGGGLRHRDRVGVALQRLQCGGVLPDAERLRGIWERIPAASLVVLLSDAFDEALVGLVERLAAARREVISIQLLTAEERDFPFQGGHVFRDPEGGAQRRVDAGLVRSDFLARFAAARAELSRRLSAGGIRHIEHHLDRPLDVPLRQLFGARPQESGR